MAELWIDPDWYAAQGSTDPMPSPGLPDIVPLVKESNLIGRVSHSRGIFPDVDCELDTGCSRRHAHAQPPTAPAGGSRTSNSANGTFVGAAAGPLPAMPIPQGRVELTPGQRIYVGAWTRIVIREATDDEKEAFALLNRHGALARQTSRPFCARLRRYVGVRGRGPAPTALVAWRRQPARRNGGDQDRHSARDP